MTKRRGATSAARKLAQRLAASRTNGGALRRVTVDELTIRRRRNGHGFKFLSPNGRPIRDARTIGRLKRLAVPPAYRDVRFASDPMAHMQAVGRDSAGRAQYRYHPDWDKVREKRKAPHLRDLVRMLPAIRSAVGRHLCERTLSREFALAAVIELIASTALRPGSEAYAQEHGTRGAATLLKSDVTIAKDRIGLRFRGKGGKIIEREVRSKRLAAALRRLKALPGRRLFQYRAEDGTVRPARRRDVNAFLRAIASYRVSLKDFRTMIACARALDNLAALEPKASDSGRRRQLKAAFCAVSEQLANTPAICRKSYVHGVVIDAFENGLLGRIKSARSRVSGEKMLKAVLDATLR
jgi:DNA topoisomerase-1